MGPNDREILYMYSRQRKAGMSLMDPPLMPHMFRECIYAGESFRPALYKVFNGYQRSMGKKEPFKSFRIFI